jgi:hypothetical protein
VVCRQLDDLDAVFKYDNGGYGDVLFRCPNMDLHVQGWFVDNGTEDDGDTY